MQRSWSDCDGACVCKAIKAHSKLIVLVSMFTLYSIFSARFAAIGSATLKLFSVYVQRWMVNAINSLRLQVDIERADANGWTKWRRGQEVEGEAATCKCISTRFASNECKIAEWKLFDFTLFVYKVFFVEYVILRSSLSWHLAERWERCERCCAGELRSRDARTLRTLSFSCCCNRQRKLFVCYKVQRFE